MRRQQVEGEMSSFFYHLMDNSVLPIEDVKDMFLENFPNEEFFFNILLSEMDN
jgi:hypothetical protein